MNLHEDKVLFKELVNRCNENTGIDSSIIEKDYYVTIFLKQLLKIDNQIIFKGGTSLSKCFKIIERFSEDIDLNYNMNPLTESYRKSYKKKIVSCVNSLKLKIDNEDKIWSNRLFNAYNISYDSVFVNTNIKNQIIVETALQIPSFPIEEKDISSILYDYLLKNRMLDIIDEYDMSPFKIKVQTLERTFVDKVFAICDYYLNNNIIGHSRHIYDLCKLYDCIDIESIKDLVKQIRDYRSKNKSCLSARDGVVINDILRSIIAEGTYKTDYIDLTSKLLSEKDCLNFPYEKSIKVLKKIIELNIF